jgi:hypothetical protein
MSLRRIKPFLRRSAASPPVRGRIPDSGACHSRASSLLAREESRVFALILALFLLAAGPGVAHAQMTGADFCQGQNQAKSSVAISITSSGAAEHNLVSAVSNETIQVCSFTYDLGGTSPTAEFDYGSTTTNPCDTGTTAMTGAMSEASRTVSGPLDYFTVPAGDQLCIKLGGTSPTAVGVLTYVQK